MIIIKDENERRSYTAILTVPIVRQQVYSIQGFGNGWEVSPVCSNCSRVQTPIYQTKYLKDAKKFLGLMEENLNGILY
jgi:hypothetical protein